MTSAALDVSPPARWLWAVAGAGTLWNAYGVVQFANALGQTPESLMALGLSESQAILYAGLPAWMSVVFGIGVLGGLAGSVALGLGRRVARPILATSLVAYVLLFAGDVAHGVFAAIPSQFAIITFVVAFAGALVWAAERARRLGLLK